MATEEEVWAGTSRGVSSGGKAKVLYSRVEIKMLTERQTQWTPLTWCNLKMSRGSRVERWLPELEKEGAQEGGVSQISLEVYCTAG
jgi:hypothetical protein